MHIAFTAGLAALLALSACSEVSGEGGGSDPDADDRPIVAATSSGGQGGSGGGSALCYPEGPYGTSVGAVIQNYSFQGYPTGHNTGAGLIPMYLADFYNPTGDGNYPAGSPYGEDTPKPRALLINASAVWCSPCNAEAKDVLPGLHATYLPMGGQFLLNLLESSTPGEAATQNNLDGWTTKYHVDFPAALDPTAALNAIFDSDSFPGNMIVDTRTMRIVKSVAGVPDESFWTAFENTMAP